MESLIGPRTVKATSGQVPNNKNAAAFEEFQTEKARQTLKFIQNNFGGGNLNEALPYCISRGDKVVLVCADMTPTHLAARNTAHVDHALRVDRFWTTPGKLAAFIAEGGDVNVTDNFGNTTRDYASNGGRHPIAVADDDVDFGQIMAGAAIVAGAGYLASEGGHDQAAEFMAGGLADVVNGDTTNLMGMQQRLTTENQAQQTANGTGNSTGSTGQNLLPASTYNFTCASGTKASIPVPAGSAACISAMKKYSRAASCNLIDELKSAEKAYYSACAGEIYQ